MARPAARPDQRLPPPEIKKGGTPQVRQILQMRGTGFSDVRTTAKQILNIPKMSEVTVVTHVCHQCACSDCEAVIVPKSPGIKGRLEPNLLVFLTSV